MSQQLWRIVQAHRDRYGPSVSEVAKRMGVGAQTLFNWRDRPLRDIPSPRILHEKVVGSIPTGGSPLTSANTLPAVLARTAVASIVASIRA